MPDVSPRRLNTTVACLFMAGSACFAVSHIPISIIAMASETRTITFFVGALLFASASFGRLVQAQTPHMAPGAADENARDTVVLAAWLPRDRGWLAAVAQLLGTLFFCLSTFLELCDSPVTRQIDSSVWAPGFYGSVLFLISSVLAILALDAGFLALGLRSIPWWIAWVNMLGSVSFMASTLAAFVLLVTPLVIGVSWVNMGAFAGAMCFFVGATMMLPAWTVGVRRARPGRGA